MIDNFYEPNTIATINRLLRRTLLRSVNQSSLSMFITAINFLSFDEITQAVSILQVVPPMRDSLKLHNETCIMLIGILNDEVSDTTGVESGS